MDSLEFKRTNNKYDVAIIFGEQLEYHYLDRIEFLLMEVGTGLRNLAHLLFHV